MKKIMLIILSFSLMIAINSVDISKMSAIELVNDMGIGWNIGNTFECFGTWKRIKEPNDQITMWGNSVLTKEMATNIKKYGFKTVRFPVTWMSFMDENGKVSSDWMKRVKEVVGWLYNEGLYVILNVHHDGVSDNWLSKGVSAKSKYVTLWSQIAAEFKEYDRRLIFESMNEVEYKSGDSYDYATLVTLTQAFVDTVRKSGGYNSNRLLLISGANTDLELTCSPNYKMPTDSAKMLAVSIHYYLPAQFTVESDAAPWTWTDNSGVVHEITPKTKWGAEEDYKEMVSNFETMKSAFINKGIPVILGEVGVLTEQKKEKKSIREFLYAEYSFSSDYNGIMSILWDTSKNSAGDMNFYNRETDEWYDNGIKNNFVNIAKGNYVKPTKYFSSSNAVTSKQVDADGNVQINIGNKKVKSVIFNAKADEKNVYNAGFGVCTANSSGKWQGNTVGGGDGKKENDGTYSYFVDFTSIDANDYIQVQEWWGNEYISINYVTVVFEEGAKSFDYGRYKAAVGEI